MEISVHLFVYSPKSCISDALVIDDIVHIVPAIPSNFKYLCLFEVVTEPYGNYNFMLRTC